MKAATYVWNLQIDFFKLTKWLSLFCFWILLLVLQTVLGQEQNGNNIPWIHKTRSLLDANKTEQALTLTLNSITTLQNKGYRFSEQNALELSQLFRTFSRFEEEKQILHQLSGKMISDRAELEVLYLRMVNFGVLYDYKKAFQLYDSLRVQNTIASNYPNLYRKILSHQVLMLSNLGLYQRSNKLGLELLPLCLAVKDSINYYNVLTTMGYNYTTLEEYETALSYLLQTLDYRLRNDFSVLAIYSYLNIGDLYAQLHRYEEAAFNLKRALELAKKVTRVDLELWVVNYLSYVVFQNGDEQESDKLFHLALKLIDSHNLYKDKQAIFHTRLLVAAEKKQWNEVESLINFLDSTATEHTPEFDVPPLIRFRLESAKGNFERASKLLTSDFNHDVFGISPEKMAVLKLYVQARTHPQVALQTLDSLLVLPFKTKGIGSDFSKAISSESDRQVFLEAVQPLLINALLSEKQFFALAETLKGSLLHQRLSHHTTKKPIVSLQKQVIQELREQLAFAELTKQHEAFIDSLKRNLSRFELKYNVEYYDDQEWELPNLNSAQQELESTTAFVHLLDTGETYESLWITHDEVIFHHIGKKTKLDSLIQQFLQQLTSPLNHSYKIRGETLTRLLFPKALQDKIESGTITDLLFSPDGLWWSVPFSALTIQSDFLIEKAGVRLLPTLSSAKFVANEGSLFPESKRIFALSDPTFPENSSWVSLPFTRVETKAIQQFFPEAVVLSGSIATHDAVVHHLNQQSWNIIHLASHGKAGKTPESSRIVLAHTQENSRSYLFPNSLPPNSIPADLVILSACESAVGTYISGEGLWSMQRAWLNVGAKSVMASLWSVNDKGTAVFMENVYRELKSEHSWFNEITDFLFRSELSTSRNYRAIRSSQRFLISNTNFSHPFYWAGFVYMGL